MKSLAIIGCSLLAFVACGTSNPPPLVVTSSSSGSSTGAPTGTAAAGTTGSSAGTSSAGTSSGPGTTGSSTGGTSTGAASSTGSSTGTSTGGNGTTTGSYIGLPCTFNTMTGVDSCEPYGYECTAEYDTTDPATCILPQELFDCLEDVGCQDGGNPALICSKGFVNNGKNIMLCAYPCKTTNDCANSDEFCIPGTDVCFNNYCDANAQLMFSPPFFNRCSVDDGGDTGQCLPLNNGSPAYCFQSGYSFTGEACNPVFEGRTGADSECDFGDFCVGSGDGGVCLPISVDGGCPDGYDAYQLGGADWDVCGEDCTDTGICSFGNCYIDNLNNNLDVCL